MILFLWISPGNSNYLLLAFLPSPFAPQLSQDIGYVLYSALGSFYLPSCIMVFVYIRIYFAAKKRARRGINKKSRNKFDPVSDPSPCPRMYCRLTQ